MGKVSRGMTTEILTNNKERAVGLQACRDSFGAATVTLSPPKTLQQYTSPHRIHRNKAAVEYVNENDPMGWLSCVSLESEGPADVV